MARPKALLLTSGGHIRIANNRQLLEDTLARQAGLDLVACDDYADLTAQRLRAYDLILSFSGGPRAEPSDAQVGALVHAVAEGTPFIGLHAASVAFRHQLPEGDSIRSRWPAPADARDGLSGAQRQYLAMLGSAFTHVIPPHRFTVRILDRDHPITRDVDDFDVENELYELAGDLTKVHFLAETEGQPLLYVHRWGRGRVHYNALGHDGRVLAHPSYRRLVVQAVAWALRPA